VEPDEDLHDVRGAQAERLLKRVPTNGVVEGDIDANRGFGARCGDVVEADSEVEGRLPERDVAAVQDNGDFLLDSLLTKEAKK